MMLCRILFCFIALLGLSFSSLSAEIKIGVSAPLSGDLAEYGTAVRQGIDLAIKHDSAAFDSIKFVYEDNKYDSAATVSALNKLTQIDQIQLLFQWGELPLHATADTLERLKLPSIVMSVDAAPALGKKYLLRASNHPNDFAAILVANLKQRGFKRLAFIATEDPFTMSLYNSFKSLGSKDFEITLVAAVSPSEQDFKTNAISIKKGKYDALGVFLNPGQVSNFCRQAAALNLSLPIFGTDIFESRNEIKNSADQLEGAVYPNFTVPADFAKAYLSSYGNDYQISYAYNAYIFAKISAAVLPKGEQKMSAEEILAAYKNVPADLGIKLISSAELGQYYHFPMRLMRVSGEFVKPN